MLALSLVDFEEVDDSWAERFMQKVKLNVNNKLNGKYLEL